MKQIGKTADGQTVYEKDGKYYIKNPVTDTEPVELADEGDVAEGEMLVNPPTTPIEYSARLIKSDGVRTQTAVFGPITKEEYFALWKRLGTPEVVFGGVGNPCGNRPKQNPEFTGETTVVCPNCFVEFETEVTIDVDPEPWYHNPPAESNPKKDKDKKPKKPKKEKKAMAMI